MKIETVNFCGWKNCIQLSSGDFRLIATTEVGPRIIGAFLGESDNLLFVDPASAGKTGGKEWLGMGGHRLWHSPEEFPRTYTVDNSKIDYKTGKNSVIFFHTVFFVKYSVLFRILRCGFFPRMLVL